MQKTRKFMIAVMAAMMVFAFGAVNAFADESPWTWSEDGTTATYTDENGTWDATMSHEDFDATCTDDAYTIYTAKYKNAEDANKVVHEDTATGHNFKFEAKLVQGQGIIGTWTCQNEGCDYVYTNRTTTLLDVSTTDPTCLVAGTITKEGNLVDPDGKTVRVQATRDNEPSHFDAGDMVHTDAVAPTCESDGVIENWYCPIDEKYFIEDEAGELVEVTEAQTVDPKLGHNYQVKYDWKADGSECKGRAECQRADCDSVVKEDAVITSEVTKKPTSTTKGETTYTATFENEVFATQTKVIEDVDYIYEPYWSDDYSMCVAKCEGKPDVAGVVTSETKDGITTFTATFPEASGIAAATATVEHPNPMVAKAKKVTAKASKKTTIKAKKAFKVTGAEGDVTYAKVDGNKNIKIAKNGTVTVKKGLKAGKTYKVTVKISATGNNDYLPGEQEVVLKVKIKK